LRFLEKAASEASLFHAARYSMYSNDDANDFLAKNFAAESFAYSGQKPTSASSLHVSTTAQSSHVCFD
jgi:hypothetical protein